MSRKKPPAGNRPGTSKARALLEEVARAHRVDVKSLKEHANFRHLMNARRDYCVLGLERGIGLGALAGVLGRDRTTIVYHQRPEMRERKQDQRMKWWRRKARRLKSVSRETMGEARC